MKKLSALLSLLLLCAWIGLPVFAAEDQSPDKPLPGTQGEGATLPIRPKAVQEQTIDDTNATDNTSGAVPGNTVQPTVQPTAPSTPPRSNGGSSGGGGYASPIVNIEAIEVPLTDGTTIVLPFLDVPQDAYYTKAVAWAYSNEITGGVADDRFDPLATCTRGQMVTFLWRAAGCPEPTGTASAFSDVAAGSYYEKAVAWAVENKITDGVGDGRFAPNGIVNRAQAVTFLYRAKGKPTATASESFTDVKSGEFYTDAVAWAVASGVTNGVGNDAFAPNANCVRGQTVTFLYRAYK